MMRRAVLAVLTVLTLALATADVARAQESRGRVQGLVSDASRAVVTGATVTLRNTYTGASVVRSTDGTGRYLFDMVDPGAYLMTVEVEGFNRFVQQNIRVENRGDVTVDAALQVGGVAETVTILESPVAVKFNTRLPWTAP